MWRVLLQTNKNNQDIIFNECFKNCKTEFITFLKDDYLIKELKLRGYTITKNK